MRRAERSSVGVRTKAGATNGGIYDVSARCCCVRLVANMPRRLRLAHYGRLQRDFGADVARDMAEAVKTYYAKQEEMKA